MSAKKGRAGKAKRHAAQLQGAKARNPKTRPQFSVPAELPSHRRKLAWAEMHIDGIERLAESWAEAGGYKVAMEPDGQGGSELAGTLVKALPDELGLIIGDALEAMRSALDNLAFALALRHTPNLSPQEEEDVSFPIFKQPPAAGHKSIKHMDGVVQAAIIGLSPDPNVAPVVEHPLWLLNKTNNRDKHRVITVAVVDATNWGMELSGPILTGPSQIGIGGPKRLANVGDRVIFSTFGPGSQVQVNMRAPVQIVFGQGLEVADRDVVSTLRWFHSHIRDAVFQALEPHL